MGNFDFYDEEPNIPTQKPIKNKIKNKGNFDFYDEEIKTPPQNPVIPKTKKQFKPVKGFLDFATTLMPKDQTAVDQVNFQSKIDEHTDLVNRIAKAESNSAQGKPSVSPDILNRWKQQAHKVGINATKQGFEANKPKLAGFPEYYLNSIKFPMQLTQAGIKTIGDIAGNQEFLTPKTGRTPQSMAKETFNKENYNKFLNNLADTQQWRLNTTKHEIENPTAHTMGNIAAGIQNPWLREGVTAAGVAGSEGTQFATDPINWLIPGASKAAGKLLPILETDINYLNRIKNISNIANLNKGMSSAEGLLSQPSKVNMATEYINKLGKESQGLPIEANRPIMGEAKTNFINQREVLRGMKQLPAGNVTPPSNVQGMPLGSTPSQPPPTSPKLLSAPAGGVLRKAQTVQSIIEPLSVKKVALGMYVEPANEPLLTQNGIEFKPSKLKNNPDWLFVSKKEMAKTIKGTEDITLPAGNMKVSQLPPALSPEIESKIAQMDAQVQGKYQRPQFKQTKITERPTTPIPPSELEPKVTEPKEILNKPISEQQLDAILERVKAEQVKGNIKPIQTTEAKITPESINKSQYENKIAQIIDKNKMGEMKFKVGNKEVIETMLPPEQQYPFNKKLLTEKYPPTIERPNEVSTETVQPTVETVQPTAQPMPKVFEKIEQLKPTEPIAKVQGNEPSEKIGQLPTNKPMNREEAGITYDYSHQKEDKLRYENNSPRTIVNIDIDTAKRLGYDKNNIKTFDNFIRNFNKEKFGDNYNEYLDPQLDNFITVKIKPTDELKSPIIKPSTKIEQPKQPLPSPIQTTKSRIYFNSTDTAKLKDAGLDPKITANKQRVYVDKPAYEAKQVLGKGNKYSSQTGGVFNFMKRPKLVDDLYKEVDKINKTPEGHELTTPITDAAVKIISNIIEPITDRLAKKWGYGNTENFINKGMLHGLTPKQVRDVLSFAKSFSEKEMAGIYPQIRNLVKEGYLEPGEYYNKFSQAQLNVIYKNISPEEAGKIFTYLDTDTGLPILTDAMEGKVGGNLTGREWDAINNLGDPIKPNKPNLSNSEIKSLVDRDILTTGKTGRQKVDRYSLTQRGEQLMDFIDKTDPGEFRRIGSMGELKSRLESIGINDIDPMALKKAFDARKLLDEQGIELMRRDAFPVEESLKNHGSYYPHILNMKQGRAKLVQVLEDSTLSAEDKEITNALLDSTKFHPLIREHEKQFFDILDNINVSDTKSAGLVKLPKRMQKLIDPNSYYDVLGEIPKYISKDDLAKLEIPFQTIEMMNSTFSKLNNLKSWGGYTEPIVQSHLITRKNIPEWYNAVHSLSKDVGKVINESLSQGIKNVKMIDAMTELAKDPYFVLTDARVREIIKASRVTIKKSTGESITNIMDPDTNKIYSRIPNEPKWGNFQGKYVLKDIRDYIAEIDKVPVNMPWYYHIVDAIAKFSHTNLTSGNLPWYHFRNVFTSLVMQSPYIGVREFMGVPKQLSKIYELLKTGNIPDEYILNGLAGGEQFGGFTAYKGLFDKTAVGKVKRTGANSFDTLSEFANMSDTACRISFYENLKIKYRQANPGFSEANIRTMAAKTACDVIPSYRDTSKILRFVNDVTPFISWPLKSLKSSLRLARGAMGTGGGRFTGAKGAGIGGTEGKIALAKALLAGSIIPGSMSTYTIMKLKGEAGKKKLAEAYKNIPPWEKYIWEKGILDKINMPDENRAVIHFLTESFGRGNVYYNSGGEIKELNISKINFSPLDLLKPGEMMPLGLRTIIDLFKTPKAKKESTAAFIAKKIFSLNPQVNRLARAYKNELKKGYKGWDAMYRASGVAFDPGYIRSMTGANSPLEKKKSLTPAAIREASSLYTVKRNDKNVNIKITDMTDDERYKAMDNLASRYDHTLNKLYDQKTAGTITEFELKRQKAEAHENWKTKMYRLAHPK
ncbi:MAG: hypothetical protein PHE15_01670 [Dehalococcoidales bacterium]|nr:hypothetical protein [Dehalococcoidales bacterium]